MDAATLLDRILTTGRKPTALFESVPIMWPPTGTGTDDEPMRALEAMAREIEAHDAEIAAVNVMAGFSFADTFDAGVSFSAVTFGDPEAVQAASPSPLRILRSATAKGKRARAAARNSHAESARLCRTRTDARGTCRTVRQRRRRCAGDAPTILRALLEHGVEGAAVVINDPASASALSHVPVGGWKRLLVGGKGSRFTDPPLPLEVQLVSQSDGRFELEDRQSHLASMSGVRIEMGRARSSAMAESRFCSHRKRRLPLTWASFAARESCRSRFR